MQPMAFRCFPRKRTWEVQEDWYAGLARRVMATMSAQNVTLYRLSHLSGIQFTLAARYIRQGRRMPAFALFRFAQVPGVTVSDLVGDREQPEQKRLDFPPDNTSENSNFQKL